MKKASVTYTKNNLSRLLGMVREGEPILVLDRDVPVASIEPIDASRLSDDDRLKLLVRKGIVTAPREPFDVRGFLNKKIPAIRSGGSAVKALLDEREESL